MSEALQIRIHAPDATPILVYLPGIHGDWTLAGRFRRALNGRAGLAEFTYPRTTAWDLSDYAAGVEDALIAHGIRRGWIIGESFSSQVAWAMVARQAAGEGAPRGFQIDGVILAGGFVRYPFDWEVAAGYWLNEHLPRAFWTLGMSCLVRAVRLLARRDPATAEDVTEFVARRTAEDLRAIQHRMGLIRDHDLRPVAAACRLPVYQLTARADFIVPWRPVRRWLRAECPGYRTTRAVPFSTHTVLFSKPQLAVRQVFDWIEDARTVATMTNSAVLGSSFSGGKPTTESSHPR
jgi:pimeloyl-ACP methyl ester carboxylesterase